MDELFSENLQRAACDYRLLRNRKYPIKGSLKLVGDRYRLTADQRAILFRGIHDDEQSAFRRSRIMDDPENPLLLIDGYNVIFTIMNYLEGHPLFIATDGLLRDAGGKYGKIENAGIFNSALSIICEGLILLGTGRVEMYLDSPVSHSGIHAGWIRDKLEDLDFICRVKTIQSADYALKTAMTGYICTSDSIIINHSELEVFDLSRYCLKMAFQPAFQDMRLFIDSNHQQ